MRQNATSIQMIPIESIHILNPRVRNAKVFEEIVHNIAQVGLKRPITVTPSHSGIEGKAYDLVCGQGRMEAFIACGQNKIPAMIIDASEEQALIMSLVENIARRKHKPLELLQGVEILRKEGYDIPTIATKIGYHTDYVAGIVKLLDNGEERLVAAVERGQIPISLAMQVALSPRAEQQAIQEAYEQEELCGRTLRTARQLIERRRRLGKGLKPPKDRKNTHKGEAVSTKEILKAYKQEVERKRLLARKAEIVSTRLLFLVEALRGLMKEDHFLTLLRAEGLDTMPKQLVALLSNKER